jgi:hypothetical protein
MSSISSFLKILLSLPFTIFLLLEEVTLTQLDDLKMTSSSDAAPLTVGRVVVTDPRGHFPHPVFVISSLASSRDCGDMAPLEQGCAAPVENVDLGGEIRLSDLTAPMTSS